MTLLPDRFLGSCVSLSVRVISVMAAVALAGCPGKKSDTTPKQPTTETALTPGPADGGVAPQDVEPVLGPGLGGPVASPPASAPDAGPAVAAAPAKPEIKPPGQDLPIDKRDAMVADHLMRGDQALAGRDADTAIREARAALDLDESNVPAMVILGHGYYLKAYDDKAEAVLNIARSRPGGEQNPKLWMLLGLIFDRAPLGVRENEALAAYETAAALKPDYVAAQTNRGAIYLKRKRYADAVTVYEAVVNMDGRSARAHCALGSAYRGLSGDPGQPRDDLLGKAENQYRLAMAADSNYFQSYYNMGLLYLDADPFPGLDTEARLKNAVRFLQNYQSLVGPSSADTVDKPLAAAEKALKKEQDRLERKRKKDAEDAKKAAETPAAPADGNGGS